MTTFYNRSVSGDRVEPLAIATGLPATARLPLTAAQLGVWTAQELDPSSARYNCAAYLEIAGAVDAHHLTAAVRAVLGEFEALRARFDDDGQIVGPVPAQPLELVDVCSSADPRATAEAWMRLDLGRSVDLRSQPAVRHALIECAPRSWLLYLRHHHIALDGYGQALHFRRLAEVYTALVAGGGPPPAVCASLAEVVAEDRAYTASLAHDADRAYWIQALADRPETVSLSGRRAGLASRVLRRSARIERDDAARLHGLAAQLHSTPSAVLIAAVAAYVARLTGHDRVVLAVPVPARRSKAARATAATLANQLPLIVDVDRSAGFAALVAHVAERLVELTRHQRYRGEELHRALGLAGLREQLGSPTVNVITFVGDLELAGARATPRFLSAGPVRDLALNFLVAPDGSQVEVIADGDAELFTATALAAHVAQLLALLDDACARSDAAIGRLAVMTAEQRDAVLRAGAGAVRDYDLRRGLHERIADQVERTPEAVAVEVEGAALTYRELFDRAGRLAQHLQRLGAGPGRVVGVHGERSLDLMVSLLGVLRAGAAYLPLDPELPAERLQFQIEDAAAVAVLSRSDLQAALAGTAAPVVAVDQLLPGLPAATQLVGGATGADAAYVIYTSGSTGRPKGVAVPHRGVVNRLLWMQDEYGLGADDRVLQKTPFTFDVSVWELFWPLLTGARLHMAPPGAHRDPRAMAEIIRRHEITTLHFVPTMLDLFLAEPSASGLPSIRRVFASGEALNPETVGRYYAAYRAPLHNLYGPTEASIDVTYWPCQPSDAAGVVPIGRAVANTSIHILDGGGEPVPFGVAGELHIGGVQVATGYVNRPELTTERFLANRHGAGTLYRTGDLALLRADGVVEYLGRLDHQIKIRGFRVELGEIEATLLAHASVAQAVVVAPAQRDGARRLVAYVVPTGKLDVDELLAMARARLPDYMVPAQVSVQPSLPRLTSGKVDRKALPALPVAADEAPGGCGPATDTEHLVHDVWCEVLGRRGLDVATSFFALGGDSILSIKMRGALERRGYTFAVSELFAFPTVRELAARIRPVERSSGEPRAGAFSLVCEDDRAALPAGVDDAYPLSALQAGIVFHAGYEDGSSVYRVVTSVHVGLRFDERALRQALDMVMRRHPALRTSLHLTGFREPLQLVHREVPLILECRDDLDGRPRDEQDRALRAWAEQAKFWTFDVMRPPLVRFTAHLRDERSFQLSAIEHHAVIDGWSDMTMFHEVLALYQATLAGDELWLPEVPSTFRHYIAAERRAAQAAEHRQFWQTELAGVEPAPLPRSSSLGRRGRAHHLRFDVVVDPATAAQLTAVARRLQVPLKSLLAASHLAVLHAVCPGAEVLTGVISHARLAEPGGDQVIGLFLNTLPLRARVDGSSWAELARAVHGHEVRTAPYRGYPYGQMVRDHPGLALDSYVNFMDFRQPGDGSAAAIGGFGIAETDFPLAVDFLVDPVRGRLEAWLDCDLGVLDPAFCERLAGYYQRALIALVADPERVASGIDLRGADEQRTVAAWSDTAVAYDTQATIHALFAQQAQRTPDAVGVTSGEDRMTYAELDARSWQLAHYLRQRGVIRGSRVGVNTRRGSELVVVLLACLRAGAAYVPLDPDFPSERLRYIMSDAALHCVISDSEGALGDVCLAPCADAIAACLTYAGELEDDAACGDDAAYLMYTSGSTGNPKGTAVRHRNVVNFFVGMDRCIGIGPGDRLLALTSISFDISVLELLWPLARGGELVVAPERMIDNLVPGGDRASFAELCERHRPTLVQATPSFFAAVASLPDALGSLGGARALLIGGEAFPAGLARQLMSALPVRIFNMYGPTETTVWSTVHELDRARDIEADVLPIGRPIANTQLRVATARGDEVPLGVAGELWIGGAGVAVGYRGMPELTAERFATVGQRWYRTGDRVRWREDGILEFLGRFDRQVKVAGHRIELDEIESVLSRHPAVASVAVIAAARRGGATELLAFVAPSSIASEGDAQRESAQAHVARWQEVWEMAYAGPSKARGSGPDDDFAGWLSSYTGEPIPAEQMRSWLAHSVARCAALRPRRVVDVGVGVGLFLRELAPGCESYLGFDPSDAALRRAEAALAARGVSHGRVALQRGEALALADLPDGSADLVLLNSVVQYFPSAEYLRRVLVHALRVVGPAGAVFVGDVRDLALLDAFHADVQIQRADPLTPAAEVAEAARRARADERELCLARDFFAELAATEAAIGELRFELKRGHELNELTRFRYDVTLLGTARATPPRGDHVARRWCDVAGDSGPEAALASLAAQVARLPSDLMLTVTDVPNQRVVEPLAARALLVAPDAQATAWDLQRALWEHDGRSAVAPERLHVLGEQAGLRATLTPAASGDPRCFDAVFAPGSVS